MGKFILRKICKANWPTTVTICAIIIGCQILWVPYPVETFFWFNGASYYTLFYSVMILYLVSVADNFMLGSLKSALFSMPLLLAGLLFLLLMPFLWKAIRRCTYKFKYPLLFSFFSMGLFCSQFTPTIYAQSFAGPRRLLNIIYYSYYLLMAANITYWLGWAKRKLDTQLQGKNEITAYASDYLLRVFTMILSVSRRTDIPNYYSQWFLNRIREGYLYVRNPMNPRQISRIDLSPEVVDCIVFWTKNPENMLDRLELLQDYMYYFQFTLTGYGRDVEPNLPDKRTKVIPVFQKLSEKIGTQRVIWRYDPIFISSKYTADYHLKAFAEIAEKLADYTERVVISFLDFYAKTERNAAGLGIKEMTEAEMIYLAGQMKEIAAKNHLAIETCAEQLDLQRVGIRHGSCIDKELIERLLGYTLAGGKDKNQRKECGCLESLEVGAYNTCFNGCKYCYANFSEKKVKENVRRYHADSPLLCGEVRPEDKLTDRKMKSLRCGQISLFDSWNG